MMKAIMRDEREMKDCGIQWLGNIPKHWNVGRVKQAFYSNKTIVGDNVDNYERLALTLNGVIKRSKEDNGGLQPEKFEGYQVLQTNELVFKLIDLENVATSRVGLSPYTGIVSPAYIVLHHRKEKCPRYAEYYFLSMWMHEIFNHLGGDGVRSNISTSALLKVPYLLIPSSEQEVIANYLDDRCSKIDAIIAEAKASIEEYKELKQAVITQAVTLGIKKNRPLKDTNILWIGKTPCDWQLAELKFFASIKSGITLGQKYPAGAKLVEMPYLRVANVQGEYVDLSDVKTIQVLPEEVDKYRLEAGVVLMTEGGDRDKLGRGCVWHGEITPCLHQNHIFALTTKSDKLLPEYFSHVTTSEVARCYFDYTAKKTTNLANTNSSTIMNFRLPIPPLEEQREIVQYLDKRIKTLNDMISEKQSLIEDLEAYKKSLIYEVVTGKRKVVA